MNFFSQFAFIKKIRRESNIPYSIYSLQQTIITSNCFINISRALFEQNQWLDIAEKGTEQVQYLDPDPNMDSDPYKDNRRMQSLYVGS